MTTRVDVVVVGGGAMGSAAAWQLAGRRLDVLLLERFEPGHAFGASHGSSRIFRTSYADPTYVRLAREAEVLWRELEGEAYASLLTTTGGVDHGVGPQIAEVASTLEGFGIEHAWLSADEAAERWPGLHFETSALFHPNSGRLHADRSVAALQKATVARGGAVRHETPVRSIDVLGNDAVVVRTDTDEVHARRVVIAAGAWATDLVAGLAPLPPIRVTQEQPAHFAALTDAEWPSFTHQPPPEDSPYGGTYGLSSGAEGVKVGFHGVGPEVHPDRRDFAAEPRQLAALQDYVRRWLPGVEAERPHPISCTYATTPDSNFVLDRQGPVVVAAGFSGHGFKFVPAIGRVLADLVADHDAPDLFSFRSRLTPGGTS